MRRPPPGAGLFLLLLTHDKIPILPAGIFEDDNHALTVRFGAPFPLCVPRALPRDERDAAAARQVMVAIGKLLPERMWGAYQEEIRNAKIIKDHENREREYWTESAYSRSPCFGAATKSW